VPHTRHPNSWGLYQRDKPPKCLAVKTKVYFQENHYKYRTENPLLKGLCTDSLATLRPQGKCNNSKGKGDSFANLSVCRRGRDLLGLSLGMETLAGTLSVLSTRHAQFFTLFILLTVVMPYPCALLWLC